MLKVEQHVATVTMSTDTMTAQLAVELRDVAQQLQYETSVSVIVIASTTGAFLPYVHDDGDAGRYGLANQVTMMLQAWSRLPQIIVVAVDGRCAQIGLSLACLADFRIGTSETTFSHTGMALGGLAKRFSQLVGKGVAMHILVGGAVMEAHEASLRGFLRIESSPHVAAHAFAQQLATQSAVAMQYTKESMLRGVDMTFQQALLHEMDLYMLVQTSDDRLEGVQAYLQKRPPQFKGE